MVLLSELMASGMLGVPKENPAWGVLPGIDSLSMIAATDPTAAHGLRSMIATAGLVHIGGGPTCDDTTCDDM